jgi:Ser/Thr protein kinase RdoA (MazF antagonist)
VGRPAVRVSTGEAEQLAATAWGIVGSATELPAEVDQNFRLETTGATYLLKIVPSDEDEQLTDLVTSALLHVAGRTGAADVQEVVSSLAGGSVVCFDDSSGLQRRARMTTFLEGQLLRSVTVDDELRYRMGAALAGLALALRDFDHPAAGRDLSWDLRHAGRMRAMLAELDESERRRSLLACLDAFDAEIVPRLDRLPVQVIHNDLSRDNTVLGPDGRLGVIDFGDIVRTQRINDVAVAMADHLDPGEGDFISALELARGYAAVEPLLAEELELLYELVHTRIVSRIVGGEWRASRFPENREYLARNVDRLWQVFAALPAKPSAEDSARLAAIATGGE